jgi:hypothetical protein
VTDTLTRTDTRVTPSSNKDGNKLIINRGSTAQDAVTRVSLRVSKTGLTRGRVSPQAASIKEPVASCVMDRDRNPCAFKKPYRAKTGGVAFFEGRFASDRMDSHAYKIFFSLKIILAGDVTFDANVWGNS